MAGISVDVVSYLRTNLRDRYKDSYSILKELVQNADDAGADELHLTSYEAMGAYFKHPLLKGPLVCIVNNAEFTLNDACAIHQAGIGTKGLDEDKIGKFGLGLKSVFHLCEALFYVSSAIGENSAPLSSHAHKYRRDGLLNPWHEQRYEHWDELEEHDIKNLKLLVEAQLRKSPSGLPENWFAIFLPLRLPEHCIDPAQANAQELTPAEQLTLAKQWALEPKFPTLPGADERDLLDARQHIERVHGVMPLLTRVRLIRFSRATAQTWKTPEVTATIEFRCETERLNWRRMSTGTHREHGAIVVQQNEIAPFESVYAVAHTLAELPELKRIVQSASWPWMDALDEDQGWQRKPAVAKQHGAVAILDTEGPGVVSINRAVFLPLAETNNRGFQSEICCGGSRSFRISLHGYCFVDAGRLGIDEANEGEEQSARQLWNQTLIDNVVLPLVIPALEEYRNKIGQLADRDERLKNLTDGLSKAFSHHYESCICRDNSWNYLLRGKKAQWEICPNATPLISLPGSQDEIGTLLKLFPALSSLSKDHVFVLCDMPSLSSGATYEWPVHIAEQLLSSVPVDPVTRDPDLLSALVEFCEHLKRELGSAIESALCDLIRRILSDEKVPLSRLRSNESNRICFAALLNLVADSRKLWIPFRDDLVGESENLMDGLQAVTKQRIVIPSVLDPRKRSVDLADDEALRIFAQLASTEATGANEDGYRKLMSETVDWMLDAWPQAVDKILDAPLCDLRLFYARDFSSQTVTKFSPFELYAAAYEHRLFGSSAQLCDKLQSCVVDLAVLYIDSPSGCFTKALGSDLPPCTPKYCTELLGKRPRLIPELAPRVALLEQLTSVGADADWASIRYLLHGQPEGVADELGLVAMDKGPWSMLAERLLQANAQDWRGISEDLLDNLTSADKRNLWIESCGPATVAQLVKEVDTLTLDLSSLATDRAARYTIIRNWPADQEELLRSLPIFSKSDGSFTPITQHTFINSGNVAPPSDLFSDLQLIEDPDGVLASRQLAPTLNSQDILKKLLEEKGCHKHWLFIMDQLDAATDPAVRSLLGQAPWLTTKDGVAVSPKHVICEDTLESYVAKLKAQGATLVHQSELLSDLTAHQKWQRVATGFCPTTDSLCRTIGESVRVLPCYRVGAGTWQDGLLESLLELFADSNDLLPAIGLIEALRNLPGIGLQQLEKLLLPVIGKRIDVACSVQALNHIRGRHEGATSAQKRGYLRIFNSLLDEGLLQDGFAERLDEISLLNQIGEWREASELAIEGYNIAPTSLVHETQLEVLRKHRVGVGKAPESHLTGGILSGDGFDESHISRGVRAFEEYLKQWRTDEIPGDAVASLIAMLGAKDGLREMYDRFKDGRDWQATKNLLFGSPSIQSRYDSYRFWISEAEPRKVDAINIRGNRFHADVATEITSLFDGFGDGRYIQFILLPGNEKCFHIRLRKIEVDKLNQSQQLEILRNTIIAIRSGIYQISGGEIDEEWEKITNVNQLDIDIAQQLILDSSAMLLETQLAGNLPAVLKEIFRDLHSVRQREKVSEQSDCSQGELESIRKEKRKVFERLRHSLSEDEEVKRHLIQMIRSRLESQSYDQSSIPFELFQNADDAVIELSSLASDDELERMRPASLRDQFLIEFDRIGDSPVLRFLHWGRGINQYRGISRENQDFSRDMERMLVLQGSGKHGEGTEKRTGGFGLGFKSVLFVCDQPVVFSGARSRFRVLAGVYPASLSDRQDKRDEERLKKRLEEFGDHNHKGTIVELLLEDGIDGDALLNRFRAYAGYLVVFSRAIRKCDVGSITSPVSFTWQPQRILENIDVGDLVGPTGRHTALVVKSADSSDAVLIPLDKLGVNPNLTAGVPEIWVTTPTGHEGRSGMLVNGAFDVNPGRTQLRDTPQNTQRANKIGLALGNALGHLFEFATNDWNSCRQPLGCTQLSSKQFWSSLWTAATNALSSNSTDPAKQVVQTVFFGSEHNGILKLISSYPALPTGLRGDYDVLAQLTSCRWRLDGILAREAIWESVSQIARVQNKFKPGTVLSSKTSRELADISEELFLALNPLTFNDILFELLDNKTSVSPELAGELSRFINKAAWKEIEGIESLRPELETVTERLSQLMFQTKDGGWARSQELLCDKEHPSCSDDEQARAAFAPLERLLGEDYEGQGLELYFVCRGGLRVDAETMVSWLAEATNHAARTAGLKYLSTGLQRLQMQNILRPPASTYRTKWLLDKLEVHRAAQGLEDHEKALIDITLGFMAYSAPVVSASIQRVRTCKEILEDTYSWWAENKRDILTTHDSAVYASGELPLLSFSPAKLDSDLNAKKEWLKLFFRGIMFRIGRLTPQQARHFLRDFEDRGWLAQLADNDTPSEWFRILDEYLEQDSQRSMYYHYMNQFLAYYQVARWLPNYVRAFEAVTRPGVNLKNLGQITEITNLRTSHIFEGATGFDAPPCYVTMGKGSHFVLREVIRSRIKQAEANLEKYKVNPQLSQQAFVPSLAVLRLLEDITGDYSWTEVPSSREAYMYQSKRISTLLTEHLGPERATFGGNYDIPLLALNWTDFAEDRACIFGYSSDSGSDPNELDFLAESEENNE
ncbi:MAG: hypothetical protein IT422_21770 [Pirellulaceae bacterium]|nr:hypothetical protein [Pirellulaceae bacterium]